MREIVYSEIDYIIVSIKPEFPFSFRMPVAIAEKIFTWVHEFTEAAIFHVVRNIAPLGMFFGHVQIMIDDDKRYISVEHVLTSLCIKSTVSNNILEPDEFWVWLKEAKA